MKPFKGAAVNLITTPDVRQAPGNLSFAATMGMDTAAYYSVNPLPQGVQMDFTKLPGYVPSALGDPAGISFAAKIAPLTTSAPSPSAAFTPLGGLDAQPITFKGPTTGEAMNDPVFDPTAKSKKPNGPTRPEPKLQVIDAPTGLPPGTPILPASNGDSFALRA
jgi:hypothetical protein